ncbi:MAG: pentapeptide repeat-containing protein [Candidatus Latescibacterota bacterium]|nr:MAG: pentapeptide repeat-containing protein [Candidatus Latescibacterota bacterium]
MSVCRYEDVRNRFRCPETAGAASPWCFWHDPERPKARDAIEKAIADRRNLTGAWLEGADLAGANLENACLYGAVLRFAKLDKARLCRADLRYADLARASLEEADLSDALLEGGSLNGAVLRKAALRYANLSGAALKGADLAGADLLSALFQRADLTGCRLPLAGAGLADFSRAVLRGARLEAADLSGASLAGADLRGADLRGLRIDRATRFQSVQYDRTTRFAGIDTSAIDPGQAPVLLRDIRDAQFLAEYEKTHPHLYRLWKTTSDCGRSLRRWLLVYAAAAVLFGAIRAAAPGLAEGAGGPTERFLDASIRLISLGARAPAATGAAGRALLFAESAAAYALFAGFLSILFHKLARRG